MKEELDEFGHVKDKETDEMDEINDAERIK